MSEAKNECMVLADEKNITFIEYESPFGMVRLDANVVRKYFVRGNGKITDGEVVMYLEQCKRHKLDPFAINEVFLIKYSDTDNATMVIGYNTFKRRAEESKNFLNFEAGIVVQRGNDIIKKEGACLYPSEVLLGGWCRAYRIKHNEKVSYYSEVQYSEYVKTKSTWREKPSTMIRKTAVAQTLRDMYPTELNGLYTPEEIVSISAQAKEEDFEPVKIGEVKVGELASPLISEKQRKELFKEVSAKLGKEGTEWLKAQVMQFGVETTSKLTEDNLKVIYENLNKDNEPAEEDVIVLDDTVQCVLDVVEEEARKDK